MRLSLSFLLLFFCLHALCQTPETFTIPHSRLHLQLPNNKWKLFPDSDTAGGEFIFKREPVIDSQSRSIIPAIMVYVEDAKRYEGDITIFAINKQASFQKRGVKLGKIQFGSGKDCPLAYPGIMYRSTYTQEGLDHIIYMIYLIDRKHHAIQLYLDMTKDLGQQYEEEFLTTIRSVKES